MPCESGACPLRHIPNTIDPKQPRKTVIPVILLLFPEWEADSVDIEQLTDGKTNTILKVINKGFGDGKKREEKAVMVRIYGTGTEILTDRKRELSTHLLLASHKLAPPLLASFSNGLIYRFLRGHVCTDSELREEKVWRAVARTMGKWHGLIPVPSNGESGDSIWTVLERWIAALPSERKRDLEKEQLWLHQQLRDADPLGIGGEFVFGHCDLLSSNIIIHPLLSTPTNGEAITPESETVVTFIDYDHSVLTPRAFDLTNHFSEWVGYECDYSLLPSPSVRREFIREYLRSYNYHRHANIVVNDAQFQRVDEGEVKALEDAVNKYRGLPGFFWGVCALIQALNPLENGFDYAGYAEKRFKEYWAWKNSDRLSAEKDGINIEAGMVRERHWWAAEA